MGLFKRKQKPVGVTSERRTLFGKRAGARLSYHVQNLQGIGKRSAQEDSFTLVNALDVKKIISEGLYAVVADGMGGMSDGRLASEAAIDYIRPKLRDAALSSDVPDALEDIVRGMNGLVFSRFAGASGTTLIAVVIRDEAMYWISVGDSSLFLVRDGQMYRLNREHTYLNELYLAMLESGEIDAKSALNDPDSPRLTEFIGIDMLGAVDKNLRPLKLKSTDTVFICSDGIASYVSESDINAALLLDPEKACEKLELLVTELDHPHQDNYTGVLIRCE